MFGDDDSKNKKLEDHIHFFVKNKIDLEYLSYEVKVDEEGVEKTVGLSYPLDFGFKANGKISNRKIKGGISFGDSKVNAGLFQMYDFKKNQLGLGVEVNSMNILNFEGLGKYDYFNDKLIFDANVSANLFGFGVKLDLYKKEIKDVARTTIGKALVTVGNDLEKFYYRILPKEKARVKCIEEIRNEANNVQNIGDLGNLIKKVGENELALKGNEASYQLTCAQFNYMKQLDKRVEINTENIKINKERIDNQEKQLIYHDDILALHADILDEHENRLNIHDQIIQAHSEILADHEDRLNQHERKISLHTAILMKHESRLNEHEKRLNAHEKRLNEHENILRIHGNILRQHEEQLNLHAKAINNLYEIANQHSILINLHGKKLNELDDRMYEVENNIIVLNKQVNIHSEILTQHNEMLNSHSECIKELYDITNDQQIELRMHNTMINEHQNAIVELYYNFNNLKERVDQDEKVINALGNDISKIINFSVDTSNIINGLVNQNQINKDLIVQNHNDCIEIKKELKNRVNIILQQQELLKDISEQMGSQWKVLEIQDKNIQKLKQFVQNLNNEIGDIYNEIDELKNKLSYLENNYNKIIAKKVMVNNKMLKESIKHRVDELINNVENFNEQQKSDFVKCMVMALNNNNYNLEHLEKVVMNILNNN